MTTLTPRWPSDLTATALGLELPARDGAGHRPGLLVDLARGFRLPGDAWRLLGPRITFDARQYRRVRLFRDEEWEALLLCWLPGQGTAVHDHGGSVGISAVLMGSLRETRYRRVSEPGPLARVDAGELGPGGATVELVDTIHEMVNSGDGPAISLHLYSPPLRVLGAHDPLLGTRWEVDVTGSPDVQVGGDPRLEVSP